MADQQNRQDLRSNFRTGDRPTQEHFEEVFESFVNFKDDDISLDGDHNLTIGGGLTLTSTGNEPTEPGTIRWNGSQFEGYNGSEWGPLGGGDSPWQSDSGNLVFSSGNVGIGVSGSVNDKLEVELATGEKSKHGMVALGAGSGLGLRNHAIFSHTSLRNDSEYALAQGQDGDVIINSPSGRTIQFALGNIGQAALVNNNFVVGSNSAISTNPAHRLQVAGSAVKDDGSDTWDNVSDIRTKENVRPFTQGLEVIKSINPIHFSYNGKANTQPGKEHIGVSAQDVQTIFPSMVKKTELEQGESLDGANELLTTNLSSLKFLLVNAIKELDKRLQKLENES